MRKFLTILVSIVVTCALGFTICWSVINFNKVQTALNGSELYTREELEEYGNNMYNQGLEDKEEYLEQINQYRDTITHLNDEISKYKYNIQVNNENIDSLTTQRDGYKKELEETKVLLEEEKFKSDSSSETISELESKITKLTNSIESKDKQIADLKKENVDALKSIDYYENFIKTLETETSVVATFVYDGQVVHLEVITKGSYSTYTNPTDTDYSKFNYWMVNNEKVNLSKYPLNTNTTFVANIEKSYDVTFIVDGTEYDSQIVVENNTLSLPEDPTKENYTFLGWSIDGVDIIDNIEFVAVSHDVVYFAVFEENEFVVTYMDGDVVVNSESLLHHSKITYSLNSSDIRIFKGWSNDGISLLPEDFVIVSDVILIAIFEDVTFTVTYISNYNVLGNESVVNMSSPQGLYVDSTKGRTFKGWSFDGINTVSPSSLTITEDIELFAVWDYHAVMEEVNNSEIDPLYYSDYTWSDGVNWYYSNYSIQYVFSDDLKSHSNKTWTGLTSFSGKYIISFNNKIYCLMGSQYVLNTDSSEFVECDLGFDSLYSINFWLFDDKYYYAGNWNGGYYYFILNLETMKVEPITWDIDIDFMGTSVVVYGNSCYLFDSSNVSSVSLYVLSKSSNKWNKSSFQLLYLSNSSFDKNWASFGSLGNARANISICGDLLILNFLDASLDSIESHYTSFVFNSYKSLFEEVSCDKFSCCPCINFVCNMFGGYCSYYLYSNSKLYKIYF